MSISGHSFANEELDVDRQLVARQAHCLGGFLLRDAGHLEQNATGLDDRDPMVGRALARAHADFGWLLRHRLVREDPDPDLAAALDVARHRASCSLDLACRDHRRLFGHQREIAESDRRAALGDAGHAAALNLAVLDSLGHQHGYALAPAVAASGGAWRSG